MSRVFYLSFAVLAVFLMFLVGLIWGGQAFAQVQKFNPMEGRWETTYPESQLRFNAPEGEWGYVTPRRGSFDDSMAQERARTGNPEKVRDPVFPSFNAFEGRWEFPK